MQNLLLPIGLLACLGAAAVHAQAPAASPPAVPSAPSQANRQMVISPLGACMRDTPAYPPVALKHEEEGRVVVLFKVDGQGRAGEATVQSSSGHARLDAAALRHVVNCIRLHGQGEAANLPSGQFAQPIEFRLE